MDGVFQVSELNEIVRDTLDSNPTLKNITVKGEISNFKLHSSGHLYFSIKDSESSVRCVMFRSFAAKLDFVPDNGMEVLVRGSVTVYVRDGAYQILVSDMMSSGLGELYIKFEKTKRELEAEGLFDLQHKRPIPKYPKKIGVVTSPTGAAIQDIINVTSRRYPIAEILVFPAIVQGAGSAESVIRGILYFANRCDVIIIGRGGGSYEDLFSFNDENLAYAIYNSPTPIISAVGHEIDFTISDFVADRRAPTPSAAAEMAVPDIRELIQKTNSQKALFKKCIDKRFSDASYQLDFLAKHRISQRIERKIIEEKTSLIMCEEKMANSVKRRMIMKKSDFINTVKKLEALSPLSVLGRGYAHVESNEKTVKKVSDIKINSDIDVTFIDGKAKAKVTDIINCERGNG